MYRPMFENLGADKMYNCLVDLNMDPKIKIVLFKFPGNFDAEFWCNIPPEDLILPKGYYYNTKNGITNKHRTKSGAYESFNVRRVNFKFISE